MLGEIVFFTLKHFAIHIDNVNSLWDFAIREWNLWIFVLPKRKVKNNRAWVENKERRAHMNKTSNILLPPIQLPWRRMKSDTNISTRAHFTPKDFSAAMKMRRIRTEMWKSIDDFMNSSRWWMIFVFNLYTSTSLWWWREHITSISRVENSWGVKNTPVSQ